MFPVAEYIISGIILCFHCTESSDCGGLFLWFYERKKRRHVDWVFQRLLLDIFFGSVIGFYALIYMYIGYINGFFRKIFFPEDIKLPLILISASDFGYNLLVYLFLFFLRGKFRFGYYLIHIVIPELVYTILVTIVLYLIILKINQKLEAIEKRSASKFV